MWFTVLHAGIPVGAVDLAPLTPGRAMSTTFVNLIETPADGQVVVIARFGGDSAPVPAALPARPDTLSALPS